MLLIHRSQCQLGSAFPMRIALADGPGLRRDSGRVRTAGHSSNGGSCLIVSSLLSVSERHRRSHTRLSFSTFLLPLVREAGDELAGADCVTRADRDGRHVPRSRHLFPCYPLAYLESQANTRYELEKKVSEAFVEHAVHLSPAGVKTAPSSRTVLVQCTASYSTVHRTSWGRSGWSGQQLHLGICI